VATVGGIQIYLGIVDDVLIHTPCRASTSPPSMNPSLEETTKTWRRSGECQTQVHGTVHVAYFSKDTGWDMTHALHLL
jgi:hypothetical protein